MVQGFMSGRGGWRQSGTSRSVPLEQADDVAIVDATITPSYLWKRVKNIPPHSIYARPLRWALLQGSTRHRGEGKCFTSSRSRDKSEVIPNPSVSLSPPLAAAAVPIIHKHNSSPRSYRLPSPCRLRLPWPIHR